MILTSLLASAVAAAALITPQPQPAFAWREGAVYLVEARVGRVTDIALEPGEALSPKGAVAAGDTLRWIVGESESGTGVSRQVHVLVKPVDPDIETNLVIATDRRTYHLELRSGGRRWMAQASWRYPQGALVALDAPPTDASRDPPRDPPAETKPAAQAAQDGAAPLPDLSRLSFDWRIEGEAPWKPVRVFDDGVKTVIDFPASVASGEMPPLFVTGASGKPELVNYRVLGRRIIVDRIFAAGELRLGSGRRQMVVRLLRGGGA